MISAEHRKILDATGIDVVRAVYAKTLTVRELPKDYSDLVRLSGGEVPLGVMDEWIAEYSQRQATRARTTRVLAVVSFIIGTSGLIVAIVALVTRH